MNDAYEQLADLLEYPDERWTARVEPVHRITTNSDTFAKYSAGVEQLSLFDLQELYTRTFDLNPVCALEIGYHLFGENYKRGEFLAGLRQTETPFELGQERQLPDYLPVLLRLLTKLEDDELHASLIGECLIPGIGKMIASFKDSENPYRHLLEAVRMTLQSEVGVDSIEQQPSRPSFARASLPILTNDPRNNTNAYEITRTREFTSPDIRVASGNFVDRSLSPKLPTDQELF